MKKLLIVLLGLFVMSIGVSNVSADHSPGGGGQFFYYECDGDTGLWTRGQSCNNLLFSPLPLEASPGTVTCNINQYPAHSTCLSFDDLEEDLVCGEVNDFLHTGSGWRRNEFNFATVFSNWAEYNLPSSDDFTGAPDWALETSGEGKWIGQLRTYRFGHTYQVDGTPYNSSSVGDTYYKEFTIPTTIDPAGVEIPMEWNADSRLNAVTINNTTVWTRPSGDGCQSDGTNCSDELTSNTHSMVLDSGFVNGLNTITVTVNREDGSFVGAKGTQSAPVGCFECQGAVPANASLCAGDDLGLSTDINISTVSSCSDPAAATKCEYVCNTGSSLIGGVCVVDPVDGVCETFGGTYSTQPANEINGCVSGEYNDTDTGDTATLWRWQCDGLGAGNTVICSANRQQQSPICRILPGSHSTQYAVDDASGCLEIEGGRGGVAGKGGGEGNNGTYADLVGGRYDRFTWDWTCTVGTETEICSVPKSTCDGTWNEYDVRMGLACDGGSFCTSSCECPAGTSPDGAGGCEYIYNTYICNESGDRSETSSESCGSIDYDNKNVYRPSNSVCNSELPDSSVCVPYVCSEPAGGLSYTGTVLCLDSGGVRDDMELTSDGIFAIVSSCTNNKCEYECDSGYQYDSGAGVCVPANNTYTCGADGDWETPPDLNTCVTEDALVWPYYPGEQVCAGSTPSNGLCEPYICQSGPLVHATLCSTSEETGLDDNNVDFTHIDTCDDQDPLILCEYDCDENYFWNGVSCESTSLYVCQIDGTWSDAMTGAIVSGETFTSGDTRRPDQDIVLFDSITPPIDSQCLPWICEGILPNDATLCSPTGDEIGNIPSIGTVYTGLDSCTDKTNAKCEYDCNPGFQFIDPDGDGVGICEQEYNTYECQGTNGVWSLLPTKCGLSEATATPYGTTPGTVVCAENAPTSVCEAWTCGGIFPTNATSCLNDTNLPDNTQSRNNTNNCATVTATDYCDYTCNTGYEDDGAGGCQPRFNEYLCELNGTWTTGSVNTCIAEDSLASIYEPSSTATVCRATAPGDSRCVPYECQTPPSLPGDVTTYSLCGTDEEQEVPNDSTFYSNVPTCAGGDTATKCQFACASDYERDAVALTCIPKYTQYECLITGNWDSGVINNCITPDYQTVNSYSPGSVVCIDPDTGVTPAPSLCDTNRCTGTIPANSTVCLTDDQNLNNNVAITVPTSCSDPADAIKCEYVCDTGFSYDSGSGNCLADYVGYTCDNDGTWVSNGPGCPTLDYDTSYEYSPGESICTGATPNSAHCVVCQDGVVDTGEECDDGNPYDTDSCTSTCTNAVCGDGVTRGTDGGSEECDGQVGCGSSCVWGGVECSLGASSLSILLGESVTFTHTASEVGVGGPFGLLVTPLNFGDGTDTVVSGSNSDHIYTAAGVYTASFAVLNPGIQTTNQPLADRVKKVCEVTITVAGGECGNNILNAGEECEIVDGSITACPGAGVCNPFICACQNSCDEVQRVLIEECDYGTKCSDFSECSTNTECSGIGDELCSVRSGDGCTASCEQEFCGDGVFQDIVGDGSGQRRYEECEWTGSDRDPNCTGVCKFPFCGDGIVQSPNTANQYEQCDPGSRCEDGEGDFVECSFDQTRCVGGIAACLPRATDECTVSCETQSFCGDGVTDNGLNGTTNLGELCDDGAANSNSGACRATDAANGSRTRCTPTVCGDGDAQQPNSNGQLEQCDDGNTIDNDLCSNTCIENNVAVSECAPQEFLAELDSGEVLAGVHDASLCARGVLSTAGTSLTGGTVQRVCEDNANDPTIINNSFCTLPTCGDLALDAGETCDDGLHCSDGSSCTGAADCGGGTDGICEARSRDGCDSSCQQEAIIVPLDNTANRSIPSCVEPGAYPVVHDDEYLPFWRQGTSAGNTVAGEVCDIGSDGKYLVDTAQCLFGVTRGTGIEEYFWQPCFDKTPGIEDPSLISENSLMIQDVLSDHGISLVDGNTNLLGISYLTPDETYISLEDGNGGSSRLPTTQEIIRQIGSDEAIYGQYEIRLMAITYDYCGKTKRYSTVTQQGPCPSDPDATCNFPVTQFDGLTPLAPITMFTDGDVFMQVQEVDGVLQPTDNSQMIPTMGFESQPICAVPFTISKPYFVQRGVTLQEVANSELGDVRDLDNVSLVTENTILDSEGNEGGNASQLDGQSGREYLLQGFVETYERSAIVPAPRDMNNQFVDNIRKVPRENIFFYSGTEPFGNREIEQMLTAYDISMENGIATDSFTFVSENGSSDIDDHATFMINGNLNHNAMYLIEGQIQFGTNRENCDTANDFVDGILLAKGGFVAEKLRNDDLNTERCQKGGLQIRGLMFGAGLDQTLFDKRRSAFSAWQPNIFAEGNPVGQARELFNTCYLPTLIMRHLGEGMSMRTTKNFGGTAAGGTNEGYAAGSDLFVLGPSDPAYNGSKNNGPVSIPAYKKTIEGGAVEVVPATYIDADGYEQTVEYCNIDTYEAYRPMIEAVKAVLVEEIYGVCNGVDPIQSLRTYCGDGDPNKPIISAQQEFGEQCDDGNNFDGDGCSSRCMIECDATNGNCNTDSPTLTLSRPRIPFTARRFMDDVGLVFWQQTDGNLNDLIGTINERGDIVYGTDAPDLCDGDIFTSPNGGTEADGEMTREMIEGLLSGRFSYILSSFLTFDKVESFGIQSIEGIDESAPLYGEYGTLSSFRRMIYPLMGFPTRPSYEDLYDNLVDGNFIGSITLSESNSINSIIESGKSFGISTNTTNWIKNPPGTQEFINQILTIK